MRKIKLTRGAIEEIQTLAMYGEPIGGHTVHLFVEEDEYDPYDWGSYPCGCCTCCGCMCDIYEDDTEEDY